MSAFRVLFVCTANHCRSPIAEQMMIAACDSLFGVANTWLVSSAGTHARPREPIHHFSANTLIERGIFVEGHGARSLDVATLSASDLILTASREHRAMVVRMLPAVVGRTFTILQFARLASLVEPVTSNDPGELGRLLLAEAIAARVLLQPVPAEDEDLLDPMGGPQSLFQACAVSLDIAIASIMRPLRVGGPVPVLDA